MVMGGCGSGSGSGGDGGEGVGSRGRGVGGKGGGEGARQTTRTFFPVPSSTRKAWEVPPAHAKRVYPFLRPSVCPSVRAKRLE
jgi:hypothetical protein